jgi:hypothetical protein
MKLQKRETRKNFHFRQLRQYLFRSSLILKISNLTQHDGKKERKQEEGRCN